MTKTLAELHLEQTRASLQRVCDDMAALRREVAAVRDEILMHAGGPPVEPRVYCEACSHLDCMMWRWANRLSGALSGTPQEG